MQYRAAMIALFGLGALSACQANNDNEDAGETQTAPESPLEGAQPTAPVSILRADIDGPPLPAAPVSSFELTVGFPDGGAELDDDALAALEQIANSEQIALGGPIVLGAHSDSDGSDSANERAAEARGLAVAGWLIERGVDEDRIDVIVFGEQNPAEPNALPDGSPNEEGRALNRRVEVLVVVPDADEADGSVESSN